MKKFNYLLFTFIISCLFILTGCSENIPFKETQKEVTPVKDTPAQNQTGKQLILKDKKTITLKAKEGADIKIINIAGDIEVQQWDNEEIKLELTVVNKKDAKEEIINYQEKNNTFEFETQAPQIDRKNLLKFFQDKKGKVNYALSVPKNSKVDISLILGQVKLKNLARAVVSNVNGSVTIENISGLTSAYTANGEIYLKNIEGETTAHNTNGNVKLEDVKNNTSAKTINGSIKVTLSGKRKIEVTAKTIHGKITTPTLKADKELSGIIGQPNGKPLKLTLATINGSIDVEFKK